MKVNIIPARYEVRYFADEQHQELIDKPGSDPLALAPKLLAWLDRHASGWSVEFHHGAWGDGAPEVVISLPSADAAHRFHHRWNQGRCIEETMFQCSNMEVVDQDDEFRQHRCEVCGAAFQSITPRAN